MPNATCNAVSMTCTCVNGYYAKADKSNCLQYKVGDNCTKNTDCSSLRNTTCTPGKNTCTCNDGWLPSADNSTCDQNKIGGKCTSDAQCVGSMGNSSCVGGTCTCNVGFTILTANLGCQLGVDSCIGNTSCPALHSYCNTTARKCACESGYQMSTNNNTCVQIVLGKTSCTTDTNCSGMPNAVCSYMGGAIRVCICATGYMTQNNLCFSRKIGESYSSNIRCSAVASGTCVV